VEPDVAPAARQDIDRLAHLERVADVVTEDLTHIGQQRGHAKAGALGDREQTLGEVDRRLDRGRERAGADLHVHDERVEPGRQLLRENRRRDQRDRVDGGRDVADRVEPPIGGGEVRGLPHDGATGLAHHRPKTSEIGGDVVPGDAAQLVERAAGVAEAAARDHRHQTAARGDHRSQDQADLVADAARRVLVEDGPARVRPVEDRARARHGAGERRALRAGHAAEEDGHREGGDLGVADRAVDDPGDQLRDRLVAEERAVPLLADQLRGGPTGLHTPSNTSDHSSSISG
jgi:hypothetical protein